MLSMIVAARWLPLRIFSSACVRTASSGIAEAEPGVVDDRRQDVVELVSDAAGQGPDTAELLGLQQLLTKLVRLGSRHHQVLADHVRFASGGRIVQEQPTRGASWTEAPVRTVGQKMYRPPARHVFTGSPCRQGDYASQSG